MNSYDEKYEIRVATESDIDDIMRFIGDNWRTGHIMSKNRQLFEYEFLEEDGTVNFILAIDREKKTIQALNGVLKASHNKEKLDVFGSFWKTLDGNMAFLGLELIKRKNTLFGARTSIGVGDNPTTSVPLMRLLKRYTGKMQHYYMLSKIDSFKIAKIENRPILVAHKNTDYSIKEYFDIDEINQKFNFECVDKIVPYKDSWYINHRFFLHPIYKYYIWGIEKSNICEAILVLRYDEQFGRKAIRIVDYIGKHELFAELGLFFEKLINEDTVEYVDFYCDGFDEMYIKEAGFTKLLEDDTNIIPNYFSPFVQENIDIYVSSNNNNTVFMKADADQDRPN